ncbi:MAG: T9SS type A sorting domain-containing protein [Ignavibacteriales bacterium]|nr:T9SS type A sorting domain-containing protein [Ignavibacteriales bacterium]
MSELYVDLYLNGVLVTSIGSYYYVWYYIKNNQTKAYYAPGYGLQHVTPDGEVGHLYPSWVVITIAPGDTVTSNTVNAGKEGTPKSVNIYAKRENGSDVNDAQGTYVNADHWMGNNWETRVFTSLSFYQLTLGGGGEVLGSSPFTVASISEKFKNWNDDQTNIVNHNVFQITQTTDALTAKHKSIQGGIVLRTEFSDQPGTNGIIEFKEPWLLDYKDTSKKNRYRNQGMDAPFKQQTSPFTINTNLEAPDTTYKGVFLNQIYDPQNPENPHYSFRVVNPLSVSGVEYRLSWFYDPAKVDLTSESGQSGYDQRAVVFKQSGATVTAKYKAYQASSYGDATGYNNQRKMDVHVVGSNTIHHIVYESGGDIWYSTSTNGATWTNEILVSDGLSNSHNPSIAVSSSGTVAIVWVNTANATIQFRQIGGSIETVPTNEPTPGYNPISWTPVVAGSNGNHYIVYNRYHNNGASGSLVVKYRWTTNSYWNFGTVPNSNVYCKNPSIAEAYNICHIAWENQSEASIRYTTVTSQGYGAYSYGAYERVSPLDWESNSYPSLTIISTSTPAVGWTSRNNVVEGGNSVHARMRVVVSGGVWQNAIQSYSYSYNSDIRPTLGGKTGNFDMSIMWSDNGSITRGTYIDYVWSAPTVVASGSSGGTYPNMTARVSDGNTSKVVWRKSDWNLTKTGTGFYTPPAPVAFPGDVVAQAANSDAETSSDETALPYRWNRHALTDFAATSKEIELEGGKTTFAPSGMIAFEIAKMSYGGVPLSHKSAWIEGAQSAVQWAQCSEPFVVEDGAKKLSIAAAVYGKNLLVPQSVLTAGSHALVAVRILDASANTVLKTISEIPCSELSKAQDHTFGMYNEYDVNLAGLEGKQVYLEATMLGRAVEANPVIVDDYYITESSGTNSALLEKAAEESKPAVPELFALYQNYPNPFNPSTSIGYELPHDEFVHFAVYDLLGKKLLDVFNGTSRAGRHSFTVDLSAFPSGTYIYSLITSQFRDSKRMMLLK